MNRQATFSVIWDNDKTRNAGKIVYTNGVEIGEIYVEVDGFYVFVPNITRGGFWTEHLLKTLANLLKELNQPIEADYKAFFNQPKKG